MVWTECENACDEDGVQMEEDHSSARIALRELAWPQAAWEVGMLFEERDVNYSIKIKNMNEDLHCKAKIEKAVSAHLR